MRTTRRQFVLAAAAALCAIALGGGCQQEPDMTFVVWSDPHFGYEPREGAADIRHRALEQMKHMEGKAWPARIGGRVERPAAILTCGDFVDGGKGAEELALYTAAMPRAGIPFHETLGNHDIGNAAATAWFTSRHGGRYYAFDAGGVRVVSMYIPMGVYCTVPPMDEEQLRWLAGQARTAAGRPMVLFSHGTPATLPNEAAFEAAIAKANVVLMLAGHTHRQAKFDPWRYLWKGRPYLVGGHCRNHPIDPAEGRVFTVVRVRRGQVQSADWRWDLNRWADEGK